MSDQLNRVKFTSATTGIGASVAFTAVYSNAFLSPTEAGAVDQRRYTYVIQQGNDIEIQQDQVWTAIGATIARGTPTFSKIGGVAGTTKITLDGTQVVAFGASALDLVFHNTHGADIASAATINLDTSTGECVDVTGTATITGITLAEGQTRTTRFTGALTLTHGPSLVLPGAANITTVAGDYAIFRGYAAGVVRCVGFFPTTVTGTGAAVRSTAPQLSSIELGHASDTTITRVSAGVIAVEGATLQTAKTTLAGYGITDAETLGKTSASNAQIASYTLVIGDVGKPVRMNVATANNLTVPPNSSVAFPLETYINIEQYGAGQTTVVQGVGVTIRTPSDLGLKLRKQYSMATLHKIGTDEWMLGGDISA